MTPTLPCPWCHELNDADLAGRKLYCFSCAHRVDVPKEKCDCRKCRVQGIPEASGESEGGGVNFSLLHCWSDRPTMSGFRGAVLATQVLLWTITPWHFGASAHQRDQARNHGRERNHIHIVYYGAGKGGDPISHCKGIFRINNGPEESPVWLEDEECETHQANLWMQLKEGEPIYGYWQTDHSLISVIWVCTMSWTGTPQALCEGKFVPQETL